MSENKFCTPLCVYTVCRFKNHTEVNLNEILRLFPDVNAGGASLTDASRALSHYHIRTRSGFFSEKDILASPLFTTYIVMERISPPHTVVKINNRGKILLLDGVSVFEIPSNQASTVSKASICTVHDAHATGSLPSFTTSGGISILFAIASAWFFFKSIVSRRHCST